MYLEIDPFWIYEDITKSEIEADYYNFTINTY